MPGHRDVCLVTGAAIRFGPGLVEYLAVLLRRSYGAWEFPPGWSPALEVWYQQKQTGVFAPLRVGLGAAGRGENGFCLLFTV